MNAELVELVWLRAHSSCEYCCLSQDQSLLPFEIDHIIACKHGGRAVANNLALACYYCNSFKGPHIGGLDPRTGRLTQLFHPRRHHWKGCFRWRGPILIGRTPIGRATIAVLCLNNPEAVTLRRALIAEGRFPPDW
jgi:HNH endonuclease